MKRDVKNTVLKEALESTADEQRLAYNWSRIAAREHQRLIMRGRFVPALAAVVIAVGGVLGFIIWFGHDTTATHEPVFFEFSEWTPVIAVPTDTSKEKLVPLSDGSCLTIAPGASLEVKESSRERIEIVLLNGWVRFNIAPIHGRTWVVDAGLGRFVVLGTQFTLNRTERAVKIVVHRGIVALYNSPSGGEIAKISAGESRELLVSDRVVTPTSAPSSLNENKRLTDRSLLQKSETITRIQAPTRSDSRRRAMPESPMTDLVGLGSSESVNALLRDADEAQKRKRNKQADRLLARILREFPDDPAVGLVALTLGRIRLDALHRPRAAASAFKIAMKSKGVPQPLKEQAYARCVEALSRAGDNASARSMRDHYKRRFPDGVWLPWVERWVGTE